MKWENTATIEAPAATVWRLTVDVTNLPSLTPTMRRVELLDSGPLRVGSRARIAQPGQLPAVWTVTELDDGRVFAWQTKRLWLTMAGAHRIEDLGAQSRNTLSLDLRGPGARLLGLLIGGMIRKSISTENAGFKRAAEAAETD
jgi:uncharacterized membrane protein